MRLRLLAFSRRGAALCERLCAALTGSGHTCAGFVKSAHGGDSALTPLTGSTADWVGEAFEQADGLVFVGATGIAVREIAPFLQGKAVDPAVVTLDERGRWAVSLLSGHIGGANALTRDISAAIGCEAVITTASDLNGVFAVDDWAARQGMSIEGLSAAKVVAAALLDGREAGFFSDFPVEGPLPAGLRAAQSGPLGVSVTLGGSAPFTQTVRLIPRCVTLGVGCRRGASAADIDRAVAEVFAKAGVSPLAVRSVTSVDLKAGEQGLLEFCAGRALPFCCFTPAQLAAVEGAFSHSERVERVAGVGCVCERAACLDGGTLLIPKTSVGPVSVAAAADAVIIRFEGDIS